MDGAVDVVVSRSKRTWRLPRLPRHVRLIVFFSLVALIAAGAIYSGLRLRENLWVNSAHVRFRFDIQNAFRVGSLVNQLAVESSPGMRRDQITWSAFFTGYRKLYDRAYKRERNGRFELDYPPLRALAVALWVKHVYHENPQTTQWRDELTWPMLAFNSVMELIAAGAAFGLVFTWLRRDGQIASSRIPSPQRPLYRPVIYGFCAALLLWFNPAVLLNAHVWPQWDIWTVTIYLLAAYLCTINFWFSAGVVVALGCMLKGQTLLVAPILVFWPLFLGKLNHVARALIGFATGVALVTAIFHLQQLSAWGYMLSVVVALILIAPWSKRPQLRIPNFSIAIIALLLIIWPWISMEHYRSIWLPIILATSAILLARAVSRRSYALVVALSLSAATFLAGMRFDGSFAWLHVGFIYGTEQYQAMTMGPASNLASILAHRFGWQLKNPVDLSWLGLDSTVTFLNWHFRITLQLLLRSIYILSLIVCGFALARHARHGSKSVLIALAAPWLLMLALLPQMHERYLLYGAAVSALAAGFGLGATLLHVLASVLAFGMMWQVMTRPDGTFLGDLAFVFRRSHPDVGWAVILIALTFLFLSLQKPSRRLPVQSKAQAA